MGIFYSKSDSTSINKKTINELNVDLKVINNITCNDLFFKKCGLGINFHLEKNMFFLKKLLTRTKVLVEINRNYERRVINISIEEYYHFFNILMNCLQIFYDDNILKNKTTPIESKTAKEDDLCCICEEVKPNMMLECYHFFCENCIETWLFKKQKNCPLCRMEIKNLKNSQNEDEPNLKKQSWSIISEGDINNKETIEEMNSIFNNALNKLINR